MTLQICKRAQTQVKPGAFARQWLAYHVHHRQPLAHIANVQHKLLKHRFHASKSRHAESDWKGLTQPLQYVSQQMRQQHVCFQSQALPFFRSEDFLEGE